MKSFVKIGVLSLLGLFALCGCSKDKIKREQIVGQWHCESASSLGADVYADFYSDGKFDLYQKIGEGRYEAMSGTWKLSGSTISGVYSDGVKWGSAYNVSFKGGDVMYFTAANGSSEVHTYVRTEIPADVLENCYMNTKSTAETAVRWF